MKMIELTKEEFENFASKNPYYNYCQTEMYGKTMALNGFEYNFVGYTTNEHEILAAGMFLTKKIGKKYYYAYSPKGFIVDYDNKDLLRRFTNNLIKYYKRKKIIFMKINPEIQIATIDSENNYERNATNNVELVEYLKKLGFKRRRESEPLQLLFPKLTTSINLKNYNVDNLKTEIKNKIKITENKGLELEIADSDKLEYLYELIKNTTNQTIDYYKELLKQFKKNNQADLILVKVNYEKYLISSKKKAEEEQTRNDRLNEKLQKDASEKNLNEKMESDKILEEYKQDVIFATNGLKNNENNYIAGAIIIKFENKITFLISGDNHNYNYLYPKHFLYNKIFDMYKEEYEIADLNGIANNFNPDSKFYEENEFKTGFNPIITEYIGELDIIINEWIFKLVEKNNLLSNEFNIKKDTSK